ncbi:hypothetical protein EsDP_00002054 [Epichloe bromicola]|uniref:Ankyrin repeat protein n=1 Tax=Epichloe bromicola TaxID=79588 RepID=A0ABQ0CJN1_9HYPO
MIQHGSFWAGNSGPLKDLTHQAWGTDDEQAPLEIVFSDNFNNVPFSLAFLQGRFDVAWAILQIVNAHDEDASDVSTSKPQIESQVVDKTFTIDKVDQISMQGKSHATPVELIRTDIARILLNADTDQSTRKLKGEDIIHACLSRLPKTALLKPMLDLFDNGPRSHLFTQRKTYVTKNDTTPLHTWICQASGLGPTGEAETNYRYHYYNDYTDNQTGEELDSLNEAGETCLHTAVKKEMLSIVKVFADYNPQQVYRENAVGRTPAELAHNDLINELSAQPGRPETNKRGKISQVLQKGQMNIEIRPLSMIKPTGSGQTSRIWASATKFKAVVSDVMATALRKQTGNRRLVSLNETNDVAGRLGDIGSPYFNVESRRNEDDKVVSNDGKKDEKVDFVTIGLDIRLGSAWPEPKKGTEMSDGDRV